MATKDKITKDNQNIMSWRKKLYKLAKPELDQLDVAHRIDHSLRVYNNCLKIAKDYKNINLDSLYAASLLHDIGQTVKSKNEHSSHSVSLTRRHLKRVGFPKKYIALTEECIIKHDDYVWVRNHSNDRPKSMEAKIFQDADRLESIGAMGIIRQFIFSGKHGKKIWDEKKKAEPFRVYGGNISGIHTIRDHEARIYKYLNTETAKRMAKGRHKFIQIFLKQFFEEWKG